MLNERLCKRCNIQTAPIARTHEFMNHYCGFQDLIACSFMCCSECKSALDFEEGTKSVEQAKAEMNAHTDKLIAQFYLYADYKIGKQFKHYKKGTIYQLLNVSNLASTDQTKFPTTAVYKDVDTELIWSRPLEEFITNFTIIG